MPRIAAIECLDNQSAAMLSQRNYLILIPAVAVATLLLRNSGTFSSFFWIFGTLVHESSHAFMAWLTARPAIPSYFMTIVYSDDASLVWGAVFALIILGILYYAWVKRFAWLLLVSSFCLVLLVALGIAADDKVDQQLITFAGLGGELFVSATLILTAFCSFPNTKHWLKFQLASSILGTIVFTDNAIRWIEIQTRPDLIPMGGLVDFGLLSGGGSGGDMDRLIRDYGWNVPLIQKVYLYLTIFSFLMVAVGYLFALFLHLRRK